MTLAGYALVMFIMQFMLAALWAEYVRNVAEKKRLNAALADAGLYGLSAIAAVAVVEEPVLIVPGVLGAFVGTYLGVKK